jgi:hypothetical protein
VTEFLAVAILFGLIGLAILVCSHERKRRYHGLKLPRLRKK